MRADASGRVGIVDGAGQGDDDNRRSGFGIRFDPVLKTTLPGKTGINLPRSPGKMQ